MVLESIPLAILYVYNNVPSHVVESGPLLLVLFGGEEEFRVESVDFGGENVFANETVFVDVGGHRLGHVCRSSRPRRPVDEDHLEGVDVVEPRHAFERRRRGNGQGSRGEERDGGGWRGVERSGEEWRGVERNGEEI